MQTTDIPKDLSSLIGLAAEAGGAILIYRNDVVVYANQEGRQIYACQDWSKAVSFDQCFRKAIDLGRIDDPIILNDPPGHLAYAKMVRARERGFRFRRMYDGQPYDRYHSGVNSEWNAQIWLKVTRSFAESDGMMGRPAPEFLEHVEHRRTLSRMTALLEQMGVAMAVVDAQGRVVERSALMARRLAQGAPLICDDAGRLSCHGDACTDQFRRAVANVAQGRETAALVPVLVGDVPHPIAVMSAPQRDGTAIVVLHEATQPEPLSDLLIAAYDLSAREAEVVVRVAGGETADDIAKVLNRKLDTVRRQIATAKTKIAVGRQHNLAHIVTRAAALFGGLSATSLRKDRKG